MPDWIWWIFAFVFGPVPITACMLAAFFFYFRIKYLENIIRVFEERPLFIIPRGTPVDDAERVRITTSDGFTLHGCYLRTPSAYRKGIILFGLEFGSDRWSAIGYCERLLASGYDVFSCELRNQGHSDKDATYHPMQWTTDRDLLDMRAAVNYLHSRPDTDPTGIGVFGISKGGSLALLIAAEDRKVRCIATDGAFATYTTMVPYMQRWVGIYVKNTPDWMRRFVPDWFYGLLGLSAIGRVEKRRKVKFVSVEQAVRRLRVPLLMIHGENDNYIKPEMAGTLFTEARRVRSKELWIVKGAKHNQALHVAGEEYHQKLIEFFDRHLAGTTVPVTPVPVTPVSVPVPTQAR